MKKLWIDNSWNYQAVQEIIDDDYHKYLGEILYNLLEDITCLKEEVNQHTGCEVYKVQKEGDK